MMPAMAARVKERGEPTRHEANRKIVPRILVMGRFVAKRSVCLELQRAQCKYDQ
jgi:hypothetical protein